MDELTEDARAAAAGDRRALDALIRASWSEVRGLCAHLGGPDVADDLCQEVYLRVVRAIPGFRAESTARTWILSIARRTCADHVRRSVRRRRVDERVSAQRRPTAAPDPTGPVEFDTLLAALGEDQREAFVLTQVVGLGYAEAAVVCGCPVGTIRSRVARARDALAHALMADDGVSAARPA